ncbi:MAG: hypothetical protein AB1522_16760 [Chloroflexota bacterium]
MVKFVCVGLDIRTLPAARGVSADATVWEQDEYLYGYAQCELGVAENAFQLLHPCGEMVVSDLVSLVASKNDAALVSLWLPKVVFESCQLAKWFSTPIDLSGYVLDTIGFDVCDIDGFFSYLDMISGLGSTVRIFDETELMDAFAVAQAANFVVTKHSPFVVVELKSVIVKPA